MGIMLPSKISVGRESKAYLERKGGVGVARMAELGSAVEWEPTVNLPPSFYSR